MPANKNGKPTAKSPGYYTETMAPMPRAKQPKVAASISKTATNAKTAVKKAAAKSSGGMYKTTMAAPVTSYKETMAMPAKTKKK